MSMIHLSNHSERHGNIPLCGRAMWDALTNDPARNECWECASINGTSHISHPHLLTDDER